MSIQHALPGIDEVYPVSSFACPPDLLMLHEAIRAHKRHSKLREVAWALCWHGEQDRRAGLRWHDDEQGRSDWCDGFRTQATREALAETAGCGIQTIHFAISLFVSLGLVEKQKDRRIKAGQWIVFRWARPGGGVRPSARGARANERTGGARSGEGGVCAAARALPIRESPDTGEGERTVTSGGEIGGPSAMPWKTIEKTLRNESPKDADRIQKAIQLRLNLKNDLGIGILQAEEGRKLKLAADPGRYGSEEGKAELQRIVAERRAELEEYKPELLRILAEERRRDAAGPVDKTVPFDQLEGLIKGDASADEIAAAMARRYIDFKPITLRAWKAGAEFLGPQELIDILKAAERADKTAKPRYISAEIKRALASPGPRSKRSERSGGGGSCLAS